MAKSLLKVANKLSEGIHKIDVNKDKMIKNTKLAKLNINIATIFLNR